MTTRHHVGLNTWESADATPPPRGHTGLYHVAFVYPDRRELGRAVQRLLDRDHPIDHATDHGATVSVYLSDPDETASSSTTTARARTGLIATAGRS